MLRTKYNNDGVPKNVSTVTNNSKD